MTSRSRPRRSQARPTGRSRRADPYYLEDETAQWDGRATRARRRGSFRRTLLVLLLLLLIAASVITIIVWQRVAAFNDTVSTAPAASSALFWPLRGSDRVNVLMIGYGGAEHGGGFLSDSINVISIDPATDQTTIVPIPRDLWVEGVPVMPRHGKINEAFAAGWMEGGIEGAGERATAVVSWVTGLQIDHWMAMDFAGFREMVDAVGGVTIENPRAFSYTWSETNFQRQVWDGGTFEAGTLHLDGREALDYTRVRYASLREEASDFARSVRQQRVLSALRRELGNGGLSSIGPGLQLMDALEGRLNTNLSAVDLFLLSGHINADRRLELTEGQAVVATRSAAGQYILLPVGWTGVGGDYGPLHRFIADGLVEPPSDPSPSPEG
jgi:polyisoprenyl-teichoic acid--peptidoglycan teichoic acid transferase